jgi:hypothetical protein
MAGVSVWRIILVALALFSIAVLVSFTVKHGRLPLGSGEVWNWILRIDSREREAATEGSRALSNKEWLALRALAGE